MPTTILGKAVGHTLGLALGLPLDEPVEDPVVPAFDPVSLFGASDRGVIFDFSDPTKLFQLSNGTVSVVNPGDPIGYVADLGPIGRPALQATAASRPIWAGTPRTVGPELIVNGQMTTDTDWTKGTGWTISGGVATKVAGAASVLSQPMTLTPGKFYLIHYTITRTAGAVLVRFAGGTTVAGISRTPSGSYTDLLLAATGNNVLEFSAGSTFAGTIDKVTVKEVLTWTNMGASFDAVDDFMQTANVDCSNSDKLTVCVSCVVGNSALAQTIAAHGNYLASVTGTTEVIMTSGHAARLRGDTNSATSTAAAAEAPTVFCPQNNVLTARFDLAGVSIATEVAIRTRGVLTTQVTSGATAGGGNMANSVITLGKGFQGSNRLLGIENRFCQINRDLTDTEETNLEGWVRDGCVYAAVLGDSTVARLSSAVGLPNAAPVSSFVGGLVCNGADLSKSGDRIADQMTLWAALPSKSALEVVILQIGQNDVKGRVGQNLATIATVLSDYQNMVNTIRSEVPATCKIYVSGINPSKAWLDTATNPAAAYSAWQQLNQAIAGTHSTTNIMGVDGRITSHVAALNDGSDYLAAPFDYNNDGVHPGNAGRFIMAQAWRTQLEADGLL